MFIRLLILLPYRDKRARAIQLALPTLHYLSLT